MEVSVLVFGGTIAVPAIGSLGRWFRSATGNTVHHHQRRLRVQEAKRLLQTSGLSVVEIVDENSPRFFVQPTGVTPPAYRRRYAPAASPEAAPEPTARLPIPSAPAGGRER